MSAVSKTGMKNAPRNAKDNENTVHNPKINKNDKSNSSADTVIKVKSAIPRKR